MQVLNSVSSVNQHSNVQYNFRENPPRLSIPIKSAKRETENICIGIRTYEAHRHQLETLLLSLINQLHSIIPTDVFKSIRMGIFLTLTEAVSNAFNDEVIQMIDRINDDFNLHLNSSSYGHDHRTIVYLLKDQLLTQRRYRNLFYGYDTTDFLVSYMISDGKS
jgi:hypothetical protein